LAKKKAAAKPRASNGTVGAKGQGKVNVKSEPASSDDEVPLAKKGRTSNGATKGKAKAAGGAMKVKKEEGDVEVKKERKVKT
jgi:hypothetical protein